MSQCKWVRVRKSTPCPRCGAPDWCSVTADGTVAKCMRVADGAFRVKQDRTGATYYLHRLRNGMPAPRPQPVPGNTLEPADADTLHAVYSALLGRLRLSAEDRDGLRARGLNDEQIDRNGYRSLPQRGRSALAGRLYERFGNEAFLVPGFVIREGELGAYYSFRGPVGLVVPCRDRQGRIVALKVRRQAADRGPRYVYVSSAGYGGAGPGSPAHCPLGTPEAAKLVRLTEGELKADVIFARTGQPTFSAPGVSAWRTCLPLLQATRARYVLLAFDMDAQSNPVVARALSACNAGLQAAGYHVELECWDGSRAKGLDDLLKLDGSPEVLMHEAVGQWIRRAVESSGAGLPEASAVLWRAGEALAAGPEAFFGDDELLRDVAALEATDAHAYAEFRALAAERLPGHDLDRALRRFRPAAAPPAAPDGAGQYAECDGRVHRLVQTREGPVPVPVCNFTARVVEEVVHDDGGERTRFFAIEGAHGGGQPLPRVEVPALDFPAMNWVVPAWGSQAVVFAGAGNRDHLRAALQLLSGDVPRRTVYTHLGWRQLGQGYCYLHAGGAVGAGGAVEGVLVQLPASLDPFRLPAPPEGDALREAVRTSLGLLRLGEDRLTFPLLAAAYRAPLGPADFAVHLSGSTGTYKSEAAALVQQHFGAGLDARHLPGNWSSTGNALELIAYLAKDALFTVDDYCPVGGPNDVRRYQREADRVFRSQGNHAGRQRMYADGSLRLQKPPRGLILSTGEDCPPGQSLRARLLHLEVSPGDFGPPAPAPNPVLTELQRDAAAGKYAAAMAGYLRWLAPRYESLSRRLATEQVLLRDRARDQGQHARTPGVVAGLALGVRYLLEFARSSGAIDDLEAEALWDRGWAALTAAGVAQTDHIVGDDPATRFLALLRSAVAAGQAHLAAADGTSPAEPVRWGWRPDDGLSEGGTPRHRPQGERIGWLVEGEVYLEPDASFGVAQRSARDQGEGFAITAVTLRRRLKDCGLLRSMDEARSKLTVRRRLQGERRDVLHVIWPGDGSAGSVSGYKKPAQPAQPAPQSPEMGRLGRWEALEEDAGGEDFVADLNPEWGE